MKQKTINYFSSISPLTDQESAAIADSSVIKEFPKGAILLKEGQFSVNTYFVFQGLVRQYNMVDGEEKTTAFFSEEQWVISLNNIGENKPSTHFWVCNEDCVLLVGNDESAQTLFNEFPRLESISRKILEHTFSEFQQKTSNYYTDSPEQRYTRLLTSQPDLIQRIPQYQLASFIGVTPESLSRIRKRIMMKK